MVNGSREGLIDVFKIEGLENLKHFLVTGGSDFELTLNRW